jgi:hypothetical protein
VLDNPPLRHVLDNPPPWEERSPIHAELDRLGATFRKAGAAGYVSVHRRQDLVKFLAPPREHPRRLWLGPSWQALEVLRALPDDAGAEVVWRALSVAA